MLVPNLWGNPVPIIPHELDERELEKRRILEEAKSKQDKRKSSHWSSPIKHLFRHRNGS